MTLTEKNVLGILNSSDLDYKVFEHEPVYTSEQASKVRGVPLERGVKALVCKTREGGFILVLVRADKKADLDRIARMEGTKKLSLANPMEVLDVTGCEIGSVPPFGHKTRLKTYMDREILGQELVNFNIGTHTKSVRMSPRDLESIIKPIIY